MSHLCKIQYIDSCYLCQDTDPDHGQDKDPDHGEDPRLKELFGGSNANFWVGFIYISKPNCFIMHFKQYWEKTCRIRFQLFVCVTFIFLSQ